MTAQHGSAKAAAVPGFRDRLRASGSRWRGVLSGSAETAVPLLAVAVGIALVLAPAMAALARSVLVFDGGGASPSLRNFMGLFADPHFRQAAVSTVVCGIGATVLSAALGSGLAFLVSRTDMPGRRAFETLNLVPFFLSPYVGAVSWVYLAAPHSGLLSRLLADHLGVGADVLPLYGLGGVTFVLALFYTPYVYLLVIAPMRQMDPALEDAARVHGAGPWQTLRLVTAPLLLPALLSAAVIVFVTSAGLFDVPLALASPRGVRTMPTEIWQLVQYPADFGRAGAFGVVVMAVTVAFTVLQRRHLERRRFFTVTGRGYRPRIVALGWRGRILALVVQAGYAGVAVVLPVAALVMVALSPIWTGTFSPAAVTWDNFGYVLFDYPLTRQAVVNSLVLAVAGASIAVTLGALQAWFLAHERRPRRRAVVDAVLSAPAGIPGIILGLGFLILALRTPLYSTLAVILIAYVAHFFPFAMRTVAAMIAAVHPELEDSARTCGASWLQALRAVTAPLVMPALVAAWVMLFVIFIRELGATMLLYADGTETISVALVLLSERGSPYVAALAVIQLVLLLMALAVVRTARVSLLR